RQLLAGDHGEARNVVDRLFRIELGALATGAIENVDEVAFDIEQPEFEGSKKPARACANDNDIGGDLSAHLFKVHSIPEPSRPRIGPIGAPCPVCSEWEPPLSPAAPACASKATNPL